MSKRGFMAFKILSKIADFEGKWIVRVQISASDSIVLIANEDPVDENTFFDELKSYLMLPPEQINWVLREDDLPNSDLPDG